MEDRVVGVLGAGQLGRMFVEAASRLNVQVRLLDVGPSAPAKQICSAPDDKGESQHVDGSFADAEKIKELASKVDVLTIEIEHVNAKQLQVVMDEGIIKEVHPRPATIQLIQDKYAQKKHLVSRNLPVADFMPVGGETLTSPGEEAAKAQIEGVATAGKQFGFPLMLKSRTQAYDGKGNFVVKGSENAAEGVKALGNGTWGLYAEKWTSFAKEVAVMVVRSSTGEVRAYPAVETVHRDNICHTVIAPLRPGPLPLRRSDGRCDADIGRRAQQIAEKAVATFEGAGVFGVEMFLMPDNELLINEIAPRPHNSGHYTIEASETSQYENHLRAILGLPLGSTALKVPSAAMVNILGLADLDKDKDALKKTLAPAVASLSVPGATTHLYGKSGCRKGRKMGHVTVVAQNDAELHERLQPILAALDLDEDESSAGKAKNNGYNHPHPLVGIIMGSDSDLNVMAAAAQQLKKFDVPFELTIVSAHRTAARLTAYAESAFARGLKCIIAGAGGAAHLPGMVAAQSVLPVIGVPVKGSVLDGVDSLHSIVQMPRGVPVATVGINNATNAGLLAVRLLGAADPRYAEKMQKFLQAQEDEVLGKVERLEEEGEAYTVKK